VIFITHCKYNLYLHKKSPKYHALFEKKLSSQKWRTIFQHETIKIHFSHKNTFFQNFFQDLIFGHFFGQKNVHFSIAQKTFGEIFAHFWKDSLSTI